jgi:hypothetical protein
MDAPGAGHPIHDRSLIKIIRGKPRTLPPPRTSKKVARHLQIISLAWRTINSWSRSQAVQAGTKLQDEELEAWS